MKLLDYFNTEYIADLALVENPEFDENLPIKYILNGGGLSESRVKQLNDERLTDFVFSNNILMFLDQTISYYFSFGYSHFLKNYNLGSHLKGGIIHSDNWLRPSLSLIYNRTKKKLEENNIFYINNYQRNLIIKKNLITKLEKVYIKKLEESVSVIISEIKKIAKIFNYNDFIFAYVSSIALDGEIRTYLDLNSENKNLSITFLKKLWIEFYKENIIDQNQLYFLNYLMAKIIISYRDGIPFRQEDICNDNSIPENKHFKDLYKNFIIEKEFNRRLLF
jgi:hypothetical protein